MYQRILIPVEDSRHDQVMLNHIQELAALCHSRILLISVAHGWVARNFQQLTLRESEEMQRKKKYLSELVESLQQKGFESEFVFAYGDPSAEIIRVAREKHVDLIAMTTHGHRFISDLLYGSVSNDVRHSVHIPVLLLNARKPAE